MNMLTKRVLILIVYYDNKKNDKTCDPYYCKGCLQIDEDIRHDVTRGSNEVIKVHIK